MTGNGDGVALDCVNAEDKDGSEKADIAQFPGVSKGNGTVKSSVDITAYMGSLDLNGEEYGDSASVKTPHGKVYVGQIAVGCICSWRGETQCPVSMVYHNRYDGPWDIQKRGMHNHGKLGEKNWSQWYSEVVAGVQEAATDMERDSGYV